MEINRKLNVDKAVCACVHGVWSPDGAVEQMYDLITNSQHECCVPFVILFSFGSRRYFNVSRRGLVSYFDQVT